jgi:hypothetical protein
MQRIALAVLVAALLGCSPAAQQEARHAWEARDAERARECLQRGGQWIVGSCAFGRGP